MEYKQLSEVCDIIMGQSPDSSSYNENRDGLPFYQGNADFGEEYPEARVWCNDPKKIADDGDILISVRAPIGAVNYAKEKCCIGRGLAAIRSEIYNNKLLYYYLKSKNQELNLLGTGSTFKAIGKDVLSQLKLPVLDSEEQNKIASILHKAERAIRLRKQQLQALDDLVKARFVEMFGDPVSSKGKTKKLSDIGRIFTGNTPPMKNLEFYDSKDIPFVKPGDISEDRVTWINRAESFISENARSVARLMPKNSVLVTCIGTIGKIGIATEECSCNQQINYIIPNESVEPVYLAYCIFFVKNNLISMANAPVVPIINKSQFSALEISVAESSKQKQFVAFVSQIDKAKAAVQKALDETQMLFDSLMQEYFG